ncbi:MAG: 5'-nucleotidase/apyrase family protein [Alphaproteobacteria bacterium]|nr:5'-nucleotidase/apyrase family protein [Alphaproteobacteria bacterium]
MFHKLSLISILFLSSSIALAQTSPNGSDFNLTILHNNDVHGRVDQVTMTGSACTPKDAEAKKCFGGFARMMTAINKIKDEKPDQAVLVLNGGDFFQGSLFYTKYKSKSLSPFLNAVKYDAVTIGNHEFDDGVPELAKFLKDSKDVKFVSSNINADKEPNLKKYLTKSLVITSHGQKIGIVGLTTEATPILSNPGKKIVFENLKTSLEREVKNLESQGINKIIALTHIGLVEDMKLAESVEGVDIYVGGHSHTLLHNNNKAAEASYPVVVKRPSGDPALIVQDYYAGIYLGDLDVTFNPNGVPVSWKGDPILLDNAVAQDQKIQDMVNKLAKPLEEFRKKKVGVATVDLVGDRDICRFEECNLGNLMADALLSATKKYKTQIALQNGGGIRTSIPKGPVNYGQVLEVLPFSNNISVFGLKGSDLQLALENGVSKAENHGNEGTGRFLQVSGLRYTWDVSKPVGSRIVDVQVRDDHNQYVPLQADQVYQIAANDFMRMGGDGYSMLKEKAINPYDNGINQEDALAAYIQEISKKSKGVEPKVEGRITKK